jgi:two-component system chemotaxis sensor kinase CheA
VRSPTRSPCSPPCRPVRSPDITSTRLGDILVQSYAASPDAVEAAVRLQMEGDDRSLGEILVETGAAAPDAISDALEHQHRRSIAESTVRVDVSVLDTLMRLVGELVLTRNQIAARTSDSDSALLRVLQRLSHVTAELQAGVMRTRMQPLDTVWNKFPRVVRDLSMACGKNVTLEMNGRETELDRTLLEAIKDPLTHIVRNAVDHGIETPEGAGPRASPRPAGCRCRRSTRVAAWSSRSPTTGTASTWPR